MDRRRLHRFGLITLIGMALVAPRAAGAQTYLSDDEADGARSPASAADYDALHSAGDLLYARGETHAAIDLLEELGDFALSRGDVEVAIDAYLDAAWVAHKASSDEGRATRPFEIAVWNDHAKTVRKGLAANAERLVRQAEEIADEAQLAADVRERLFRGVVADD